MSIDIEFKDVELAEIRGLFRRAISEAFPAGVDGEAWTAVIGAPPDCAEYRLSIKGPNGFEWKRCFFGPVELNKEFVVDAVRSVLESRATFSGSHSEIS